MVLILFYWECLILDVCVCFYFNSKIFLSKWYNKIVSFLFQFGTALIGDKSTSRNEQNVCSTAICNAVSIFIMLAGNWQVPISVHRTFVIKRNDTERYITKCILMGHDLRNLQQSSTKLFISPRIEWPLAYCFESVRLCVQVYLFCLYVSQKSLRLYFYIFSLQYCYLVVMFIRSSRIRWHQHLLRFD